STSAQGLVSLEDRYPEALLLRSPDLTELMIARTLGPVLELSAFGVGETVAEGDVPTTSSRSP
ncbi:hypothetical protein, partial [Nocardia gipuzkoensis]|uniref:hypothetical protein n=1 Tax=Nocardia gipuzkoensis TaxID=2749991 RepID=UPI001C686DEA